MAPSPLTITRLDKVAADNGFDRELPREDAWLAYASTRVPLRIWLTGADDAGYFLALSDKAVASELGNGQARLPPSMPAGAVALRTVQGIPELHALVRRAFQLSRTLPDALLRRFERQAGALPRTTEAERLVVQRVGQAVFRDGLLEYWQGRCAITGLAIPELLRASHIKPWAACGSDAERLDVFNGLLLAAHLDAAFDAGFITIATDGRVDIAAGIDTAGHRVLGLDMPLRIAGVASGHQHYLEYHRAQVFRGAGVEHTGPSHAVQARTRFQRYIGIDYSGAETPSSPLPGLRVYSGTPNRVPTKETPAQGRHWTRRGVAEWLIRELRDGPPTIVGIDHCFSFPAAYFARHGLERNWYAFIDDFCAHWPTDDDRVCVDFVREGVAGNGAARHGDSAWRRISDVRARGAKSPFHFDVPGSVAKSTHAGLPWLRFLRRELDGRVHFWPFDGWDLSIGRSAIVEVYPALCRPAFPLPGATPDEQDAYAVAAWLRDIDTRGALDSFLRPSLSADERDVASFEGWILGVS